MHAVEFEADIENNTIQIPPDYQNLNKAHVRVILLTPSAPKIEHSDFNPRDFFGAGKQSKQACDDYLADVRKGWR